MAIAIKPREVKFYYGKNQKSPCRDWLDALQDKVGKRQILSRINRAERGNFGDHKHLKDGIWELRVDFGPGYRIYFALDESDTIILLLAGGSKRSQASDIEMAKELWQSHKQGV